MISGTIKTGLPAKFNSNKLAAEVDALGNVGWKFILDDPQNIEVYYEYDEALGLKRGDVEAVFKGHALAANEDDDNAVFEKAQQSRKAIEDRVSILEQRVAALEKK